MHCGGMRQEVAPVSSWKHPSSEALGRLGAPKCSQFSVHTVC